MPWIDGNGNIYVDPLTKNVGIGTPTPATRLHVIAPDGAYNWMTLENTAQSGTAGGLDFVDNRASGRHFRLSISDFPNGGIHGTFHIVDVANGAPRISIAANGNVGIGTTSPSNLLTLKPATNVAQLRLEQDNTTDAWTLFASDASGIFQIARVGAGANTPVTILQNGNVGIGTPSPGAKLDVAGGAGVDNGITVSMGAIANLRLVRSDAPGRAYIVRTDADQKFKIIDESAPGTPARLVIDTAGNVGIGTPTPDPSAKLDVAGNVKVTGGSLSLDETQRMYFDTPTNTKYAWMNNADADPGIPGTHGRVAFSYNLFIRKEWGNLFLDPPQMWIGPHGNDFLYMVIQETAQGSNKWQAAVQTARRPQYPPPNPNPIDRGYGFHPLRLWGKTFLASLEGHLVTGSDPATGTFAQQIYFQKTLHIDPADGQARYPDHYTDGRPYYTTDDTYELGGVTFNTRPGALGVRIYRDAQKVGQDNWTLGPDLVLEDITNGALALGQLVRSNTSKLKVATGNTGDFTVGAGQTMDSGTISLPAGFFSSPPRIFLSAENSGQA